MQRSYRFLLVVLVVGLAFWTAGCGSSGKPRQAPAQVRLTESMHTVFFAPVYVALNKGYFDEEGLRVSLQTISGELPAITDLGAGRADVILGGPEDSIHYNRLNPTTPVFSFAQLTKRDGSLLMSAKPLPGFAWNMLKDHTVVGFRKGSAPEMFLEYVLRQHSLKPQQDLTVIQNIPIEIAPGAFTSGTGEFIQVFEPTAGSLEQAGKAVPVASLAGYTGDLPYSTFMTTGSFFQANPQTLQKFTTALYRAQLWVATHPPEEITAAIASSFPGRPPGILLTAVKRYKAGEIWCVQPTLTTAGFERFQEVMQTAGELQARAPFDSLATNAFAREAINAVEVK